MSRGGVFHDARDLGCSGVRTARQAETASHSQPAMKQLPPMGVRMPSGRVPVDLPECCLADGLDYKAAG